MKRKNVLSLAVSLLVVMLLVMSLILAACAPAAPTPGAPTRITPQVPEQKQQAPVTVTPTVPKAAKPAVAPAPAAEVIEWKCQAAWVPTAFEYSMVDEYFKILEEASGGRIAITQYPGGALIPTAEHFDAIKEGIIQMVNSTSEYWPGMMPEANMESGYPGTWRNIQDMEQLFYRVEPRNLTDVMREAYGEQNIYAVAIAGNVAHSFWTKFPITSLADLQGIKMRAPGTTAKVLDKLGVATVYIPHEEVYMALQLGTIDASATSGIMYDLGKYYEFCKYYHVPYIGSPGHWSAIANLDAWNELPADLAVLVEKMMKLAYWDARLANDTMMTKMEANAPALWGTTIVTLPDEVMIAAGVASVELMEEQMTVNARCNEMGEIIKEYMTSVGYLK